LVTSAFHLVGGWLSVVGGGSERADAMLSLLEVLLVASEEEMPSRSGTLAIVMIYLCYRLQEKSWPRLDGFCLLSSMHGVLDWCSHFSRRWRWR
jgi:hypothetical protein